MFILQQCDAVQLENQIRRLFNCDRYGVSGLVSSDRFASHPMEAAVMVLSYIYAKELQNSNYQYSEFFSKYDTIFSNPDEKDAEKEVENYIADLKKIIEEYL